MLIYILDRFLIYTCSNPKSDRLLMISQIKKIVDKKSGLLFSFSLSVCLSVCLYVCLSVCHGARCPRPSALIFKDRKLIFGHSVPRDSTPRRFFQIFKTSIFTDFRAIFHVFQGHFSCILYHF